MATKVSEQQYHFKNNEGQILNTKQSTDGCKLEKFKMSRTPEGRQLYNTKEILLNRHMTTSPPLHRFSSKQEKLSLTVKHQLNQLHMLMIPT